MKDLDLDLEGDVCEDEKDSGSGGMCERSLSGSEITHLLAAVPPRGAHNQVQSVPRVPVSTTE